MDNSLNLGVFLLNVYDDKKSSLEGFTFRDRSLVFFLFLSLLINVLIAYYILIYIKPFVNIFLAGIYVYIETKGNCSQDGGLESLGFGSTRDVFLFRRIT